MGCLRKLQRWNLASIFSEYRRFAGFKVRAMNEQFIELFDTDLVTVPSDAPLTLNVIPTNASIESNNNEDTEEIS